MEPKTSIKKYMNELSKMTGEEMLKEYLAKVMPVYMAMSYSNVYSINFEELRVIGLKDLGVLDILELVENILSENFDDTFKIEYENYWWKANGEFVHITLVK